MKKESLFVAKARLKVAKKKSGRSATFWLKLMRYPDEWELRSGSA
ncbi:hypothetical protein [Larkinella ripae]